MILLTIDPKDERWLDSNNRAGKPRMVDPRDPLSAVKGESSRYASWAWNRLTSAYRRRYGRSLEFFRGNEAHRSGMVHLHVLVRVQSTEEFAWLRAVIRGDERVRESVAAHDRRAGLARMAGFGLVASVELARSAGDVARYVTKAASGDRMGFEVREGQRAAAYVSKGVSLAMPRYTRRTSWSMKRAAWAPDWRKPAPIAGFWWRLDSMPPVHAAAVARSQGFVIGDPERYRVPDQAVATAGGY